MCPCTWGFGNLAYLVNLGTKWRWLVSFPPRPSVPVTGQGIWQKRNIVYRKLNHGSSVVQPIAYWLHPVSYVIMSLPVFVACSNMRCVCVRILELYSDKLC